IGHAIFSRESSLRSIPLPLETKESRHRSSHERATGCHANKKSNCDAQIEEPERWASGFLFHASGVPADPGVSRANSRATMLIDVPKRVNIVRLRGVRLRPQRLSIAIGPGGLW